MNKSLHFKTIMAILILLFALPFAGKSIVKQGSFTTGTGTNQMDLTISVNTTNNLVTFTMTGPATRWFGYALDVSSMSPAYTILGNVNANNPAEYTMSGQSTPSLQSTQNLTFVSTNTVSGRKTYIFTRALNTGDANDYTFLSSISNLNIIWAYGSGTSLAQHANRGSSSITFTDPCAGIGSSLPSLHICTGDSALIFGIYRKVQAVYRDTIHLQTGCDSIISRTLFVHAPTTTTLSPISICSGDSVLVFGSYRKVSGTYTNLLSSVWGCDSTISRIVNVRPKYNISLPSSSICQGDSILIFGSYRKTSGTYSSNLLSMHGCDSIVSKELLIKPTYFTNLGSQSICQGDSALIFGIFRKTSGTFTQSFSTVLNCDSSFSKTLIVNPSYSINLGTSSHCSGDSVLLFGQYRKVGGTYTNSLSSMHGCDSILSKTLVFNSAIINNLGISNLCFGDSILVFGKYIKTSGVYSDTTNSAFGCDSITLKNVNVYSAIDTMVTKLMYTLSAATGADSYQWFDCNTNQAINGANLSSFTATQNGLYKVRITKNNCIEFSACHYIGGIGMEENKLETLLRYFPNPTQGTLTIDLGFQSNYTLVKIYSIDGLLTYKQEFENQETMHINLQALSSGLYYVVVETAEGSKAFKVVKE